MYINAGARYRALAARVPRHCIPRPENGALNGQAPTDRVSWLRVQIRYYLSDGRSCAVPRTTESGRRTGLDVRGWMSLRVARHCKVRRASPHFPESTRTILKWLIPYRNPFPLWEPWVWVRKIHRARIAGATEMRCNLGTREVKWTKPYRTFAFSGS